MKLMALIGKVRKLYTWLLWDSHKSINQSCCSLNKTKRNKGHKVWAWVINLWSTSLAHLYGHMCSIIPIVNHQNQKIVNENTTSKPTAKYISTRKKLCWQFHMCVLLNWREDRVCTIIGQALEDVQKSLIKLQKCFEVVILRS